MNLRAVRAIYLFEMARTWRTLLQSIVSPVVSTSLYFVVFGAAIGSRITQIEGVSYGTFIVPGLVMLSVLTQSIANASFGIYFPKFVGTIYELLSAPISYLEIVLGEEPGPLNEEQRRFLEIADSVLIGANCASPSNQNSRLSLTSSSVGSPLPPATASRTLCSRSRSRPSWS